MVTRYVPRVSLNLDAMGIELPDWPEGEHPNARPFRGVLTRVDEPSDRPPNGARDGQGRAHRVLIPRDVAEQALPTLIAMAVDVKIAGNGHGSQTLKDHDARRKVGVITQARIEGRDLRVEGILYAKDFPDVMADLDRHKTDGSMGMSYEITDVQVVDAEAPIWTLSHLTFTGAAILERKSAAYERTSLQARRDSGEQRGRDDEMTASIEDRLKAVLLDLKDRKLTAAEDEEARKKAEDEEARKRAEGEEARKKAGEDEDARRVKGQGSFRPEEEEDDEEAVAALAAAFRRMRGQRHEDEAQDKVLFKRLMDQMKARGRHGAEDDEEATARALLRAMGYRSRRREDEDAKRVKGQGSFRPMPEEEDDEDAAGYARRALRALRRGMAMYREEDDEEAVATVVRAMMHKGPQKDIPKAITHAAALRLEARIELLTDAVETMRGLLTDRATTAKGLATDKAATDPQGGKVDVSLSGAKNGDQPKRKTMEAARGMDDRWLSKLPLEEGRQYSTAEVDQMFKGAGVTDPETRMRLKLDMEAKGLLAPIA